MNKSKKLPDSEQLSLSIDGMTCSSCELMLERKLKKVPGVQNVLVNHKTGMATMQVDSKNKPSQNELEAAIEEAGYTLDKDQKTLEQDHKWVEIGTFLVLIFALYKLLQNLDLSSLTEGATRTTTLASVLLIGLVAGTSSCLAVTGGLLLSMAAKYNEVHGGASRWQKFKPLLMFNLGRLASYFLLGGLVGVLGQSITLSPFMTGVTNIVVALIMFTLALTLLNILPKGILSIRPPKWVAHKIADISEHEHPAAPFALGALTFFLPCGFTQSLQLVALASGSFFVGSMTMFIFALGTLPALLGISAISASAQGRASQLFIRFSGTLVLVLALFNLKSGLVLAGIELPNFSKPASEITEPNDEVVTQTEELQTIHLTVNESSYSPETFTIEAGKQTQIVATVKDNIWGCIGVLTVPDFGLSISLEKGENQLGPFIPTQDFYITCPMGMFSAKVHVTN